MSIEPGWVWLQREAGEEPQADEEAALELLPGGSSARPRSIPLAALGLLQHPDQHLPQRPILLAGR